VRVFGDVLMWVHELRIVLDLLQRAIAVH
jgi:hypothetical protein